MSSSKSSIMCMWCVCVCVCVRGVNKFTRSCFAFATRARVDICGNVLLIITSSSDCLTTLKRTRRSHLLVGGSQHDRLYFDALGVPYNASRPAMLLQPRRLRFSADAKSTSIVVQVTDFHLDARPCPPSTTRRHHAAPLTPTYRMLTKGRYCY